LPLRPRPEVENLEGCPHGGINQAELEAMGLSPEAVLDFSVCSNPFMPPPGVMKALDTIAVNRYPDSEATEFRRSLSAKLGVTLDNVLAGSGAVELIRLVAWTYFGHGDSVLVLEPTFGEYRVACQIVGADVVGYWGVEEEGFATKVEETLDLIQRCHPRGVFICNPNNPTGQYLSKGDVERILDACADSLIILDEAYISFVDGGWSSICLLYTSQSPRDRTRSRMPSSA